MSRVPRVSNYGGNGYQPFALPSAVVGRRGFSEKIPESEVEVDRSGSIGIGLTEKEIDERVSAFHIPPFNWLLCRNEANH